MIELGKNRIPLPFSAKVTTYFLSLPWSSVLNFSKSSKIVELGREGRWGKMWNEAAPGKVMRSTGQK